MISAIYDLLYNLIGYNNILFTTITNSFIHATKRATELNVPPNVPLSEKKILSL